jgi:hypothetical protein
MKYAVDTGTMSQLLNEVLKLKGGVLSGDSLAAWRSCKLEFILCKIMKIGINEEK